MGLQLELNVGFSESGKPGEKPSGQWPLQRRRPSFVGRSV